MATAQQNSAVVDDGLWTSRIRNDDSGSQATSSNVRSIGPSTIRMRDAMPGDKARDNYNAVNRAAADENNRKSKPLADVLTMAAQLDALAGRHEVNLLKLECGRINSTDFIGSAACITWQNFFNVTADVIARLKTSGDQQAVQSMPQQFAASCHAEIQSLSRLPLISPRSFLALSRNELSRTQRWLIAERNVWLLLGSFVEGTVKARELELGLRATFPAVFPHRTTQADAYADDDDFLLSVARLSRVTSDADLAQFLAIRSTPYMEKLLALQWLEQTAWDRDERRLETDMLEKCLPGVSSQVGWQQLLAPEDSDSTTLNDAQREDDERTWRIVFRLLRCGRLTLAQNYLVQVGLAWKAALFEGMTLFRVSADIDADADAALFAENSEQPVAVASGSPHRLAWKRQMWLRCESSASTSFNKFERAVYGLLCGHLEAMLPVCEDWTDVFWACLNTQSQIQLETFLVRFRHIAAIERNEVAHVDSSMEALMQSTLPNAFWVQRPLVEAGNSILAVCDKADVELFPLEDISFMQDDAAAAADDDNDNAETILLQHIVQAILLADTQRLAHVLDFACSTVISQSSDANVLRFLAHFLIVIRLLGLSVTKDAGQQNETSESRTTSNVNVQARNVVSDEALDSIIFKYINHVLLPIVSAADNDVIGLYGQLLVRYESKNEVLRLLNAVRSADA